MNLNFTHRPHWLPRWLNWPLVIFVAFICMMLFFGDNNYMRINRYKQEINELKAEIKAQQDSTIYYSAQVRELNTDRETLEKIAREKYGMRRTNEEIFLVDE